MKQIDEETNQIIQKAHQLFGRINQTLTDKKQTKERTNIYN